MTDLDLEAKRLELYDRTRNELLEKQLSNSETYDKSLLTLSSAFLGLSLTFLKDIVPLAQARHFWVLSLSWLGFTVVIVGTIWSFIYGQRVIKRLLEAARRYYKEQDQTAFEVSQKYSERLDYINELSGFAFIASVIFSVAFVIANIQLEGPMSKQTNSQRITVERSQPVNQFQAVKPAQNPVQSNQQQSGTQQSNNTPKPKE